MAELTASHSVVMWKAELQAETLQTWRRRFLSKVLAWPPPAAHSKTQKKDKLREEQLSEKGISTW